MASNMRLQISFTMDRFWTLEPHDVNLERALRLAETPYCAVIKEVLLGAHFEAYRPGGPYRRRSQEEPAVAIAISLEALAEYCSDCDVVATILAQDHWDLVAGGGPPITHHLFISEPASSAAKSNDI